MTKRKAEAVVEVPTNRWQNRIVGYGSEAPDQLLANPFNFRIHSSQQQDSFLGVIHEVGLVQNVIVNRTTQHVIDGHMRIALALREEQPDIPITYVELTEDEERLVLASYDAISAMAALDAAQLDTLLKSVNSDAPAVQEMLAKLAEDAGLYQQEPGAGGDANALMNRAEELREQWGVERGQLWTIGRHRLLCGDSYSMDDVTRLTDGFTVNMLHTDPPYGINIVQPHKGDRAAAIGGAKPFGSTASSKREGKSAVAFRNSGKVGGGTGALVRQSRTGRTGGNGNRAIWDGAERAERVHVQHGEASRNQIIQSNVYPVIEGDDHPFDPALFLKLAPIVIMWGANYFADKLPPSSCWICWDKREDITRNNFADCELAWSNMDKPARVFHHLWNGLHKGSQHGQRRIHPTEKPVALFEQIGNMFCEKGVWLDLFAGSGAQIEAAERSGATCLALEYEPLYVGCVLQRLADMGLTPELQAE